MTARSLAALCLAAFSAGAVSAGAGAANPPALTLEDAIRKALEAHPLIRQWEIDVSLGEVRASLARSGRLPFADLSGLSKVGLSGSATLFGLQGIAASPEPEGAALSGNVVQDLLDFKRSKLEREARLAELQSLRQTLLAGEARVVREVNEAYHSAASADRLVGAAEALVWERTLARRRAAARLRAGLGSGLEARESDALLARAERDLEAARDSMSQAHARLVTAMGEPAAQAYGLRVPAKVPDRPPGLESLRALSLEQRPELAAVSARIRAGEHWVTRAEREKFPRVMVMFSGGWARFAELTLSKLLFGGFGIQLPLLSRGQLRAGIDEARLALEKTSAVRDELDRAIQLEVSTSRSALLAALESHRSAETDADRARDAERLERSKYENGLVSLLEWTAARSELARREAGLTRALCDTRIAQGNLEFAVGALEWLRPSP